MAIMVNRDYWGFDSIFHLCPATKVEPKRPARQHPFTLLFLCISEKTGHLSSSAESSFECLTREIYSSKNNSTNAQSIGDVYRGPRDVGSQNIHNPFAEGFEDRHCYALRE